MEKDKWLNWIVGATTLYAAGVENFSELTLGRNEDETKRIRNPSIIMFINITKYHIAANC